MIVVFLCLNKCEHRVCRDVGPRFPLILPVGETAVAMLEERDFVERFHHDRSIVLIFQNVELKCIDQVFGQDHRQNRRRPLFQTTVRIVEEVRNAPRESHHCRRCGGELYTTDIAERICRRNDMFVCRGISQRFIQGDRFPQTRSVDRNNPLQSVVIVFAVCTKDKLRRADFLRREVEEHLFCLSRL